ncbi:hypothetical protein K2173_009332 [Erythroxylum novogranatense]|uniref:B3 domain-containing protein n=1 Tax=Erythroxylum novogranatense TaxID=1862640 RepID=A0AAV8U3P1_9ROSI|nr:hypothetical protein K2173_009332 [Erythroxylum novogranatense]
MMQNKKKNKVKQQHQQLSSVVDLASFFSLPPSCKKKRGSNGVPKPEDKPQSLEYEDLASKDGNFEDAARQELKDPVFTTKELSLSCEDQHLESLMMKVKNVKRRCYKSDGKVKEVGQVKKRKVMKFGSFEQLGVSASEMPADMKDYIENFGGTNPVIVIVKPLYRTDLSRHHGRFTFPLNQIKNEFLTLEEKAELDNKRPLNVGFIEPSFDINSSMRLTKRTMKNTSCYTLTSGWNSVLDKEKNDMEEGDWAQLWSFRWSGNLHFSLTLLRATSRGYGS